MEQSAMETTNYSTNEDANELASSLFAELALSETDAHSIRAGRDFTSAPPPPCPGCGWGGPVTNHNETVSYDEADLGELDDLQLSIEDLTVNEVHDAALKGGPIEIKELQIRVHVGPQG